jgi:hypothetical protein
VRKPLLLSTLFHAVIIAMMFISFDLFGKPEIIEDTIAVELVPDDVGLTAIPKPKPVERPEEKPPTPEEKPPAEKAPEVQEEMASDTPPRVDEVPETPPPEVAPTPEPEKTLEPPKPQRVTRDLPNVTPRDKPKPPKKFDMAAIEKALLDKRDSTLPQTREPPKRRTDPDPQPAREEANRSQFEDAQARASIAQAIASQIRRCWNAPVGATGAETLSVRLRIYLRADGELRQPPVIVDAGRMRSDELYRVAAEAAKRAVHRCAPLKLPTEYYDIWADVTLDFDPSNLL